MSFMAGWTRAWIQEDPLLGKDYLYNIWITHYSKYKKWLQNYNGLK